MLDGDDTGTSKYLTFSSSRFTHESRQFSKSDKTRNIVQESATEQQEMANGGIWSVWSRVLDEQFEDGKSYRLIE
jgi:hypothetical protein